MLGAGAVAAAFPAVAAAQETLSTGHITSNKGFQLRLGAIRGGPEGRLSTLSASLTRRWGAGVESSVEVDRYDFSRGVVFTGRSDLAWARVDAHLLGHRGSVHLTFRATGRARKVPLPKGCSGSPGAQRRGHLRGSFALYADRLGTVRLKVITATVRILPSIVECRGGGGLHGTALFANGSTNGHALYVFAFKPRSRGLVQEGVSVAQVGEGYSFSHSLTVLAPRAAYEFGSALESGRLQSAGRLSGGATYWGRRAMTGVSQGTVFGDLAASFATVGRATPFARGPLSAAQLRY